MIDYLALASWFTWLCFVALLVSIFISASDVLRRTERRIRWDLLVAACLGAAAIPPLCMYFAETGFALADVYALAALTPLLLFACFKGDVRARLSASIAALVLIVALLFGVGMFAFDPRGVTLLYFSVMVAFIVLGFHVASIVFNFKRLPPSVSSTVMSVVLASIGLWLMWYTRVATPYSSDPFYVMVLCLAIAPLLVSLPARIASVVTASILAALVVAGRVPYIMPSGCEPLGYALVLSVLIALSPAIPKAFREFRLRAIDIIELLVPIGLLISALMYGSVGSPASLATLSMAVTPLALHTSFESLIASFAAGLVAWSAIGAYAVSIASLAGVVVFALLYGRSLKPKLQYTILLLSLIVFSIYALQHSTIQTLHGYIEPVKLDGMGLAPPPSETVVHGFYPFYLAIKAWDSPAEYNLTYLLFAKVWRFSERQINATLSMGLLIWALANKTHILDTSKVLVFDKVRGIYINLSHPEKLPMPLLLFKSRSLTIEIPVSPGPLLRCWTRLIPNISKPVIQGFNIIVPIEIRLKDPNCTTATAYLKLLVNPRLPLALRYVVYAAMCISWSKYNSLNMTMPLLVGYAFNESRVIAPVPAEVRVRVVNMALPLALMAYTAMIASVVSTLIPSRFVFRKPPTS